MNETASDISRLFEDYEYVCLLINEISHNKKGNKSVGVARQYNGQLGKVDNFQTAVYAAPSEYKYYGLIDARLYLPQSWTTYFGPGKNKAGQKFLPT